MNIVETNIVNRTRKNYISCFMFYRIFLLLTYSLDDDEELYVLIRNSEWDRDCFKCNKNGK